MELESYCGGTVCPLVAHSFPDDLTFSLTASRCYLMGVLQSVLVPDGLLASGKVLWLYCHCLNQRAVFADEAIHARAHTPFVSCDQLEATASPGRPFHVRNPKMKPRGLCSWPSCGNFVKLAGLLLDSLERFGLHHVIPLPIQDRPQQVAPLDAH